MEQAQQQVQDFTGAPPGQALAALQATGGNVQTAVEMLLDSTAWERLDKQRKADEAKLELERKQEAKTEKQFDRQARKATIERNGQQRDYAADGEKLELSAPRLPYAKTRKEALGGPKTRYLDGQAVSTKGNEKFIVVDQKEEWDGGSRGRVKTKGKRGPGGVSIS